MNEYGDLPCEVAADVYHPTFDAVVVDLDNCISDDKWRWPLFDLHLPVINERYTRYHDVCDHDEHRNADVVRELNRMYSGRLIVFTSRPECVRGKTERWLRNWRVPYSALFMRPDDNHEPSTILKRRMLTEWLDKSYNVVHAIDDRVDILEMYADEGVRICQRVFIHEPEHTHP